MMNSLWIAKTGMSAQQTQMDVVSHNLSNVSTTGYKRQSAVFEDLIYQNLRQVGAQADEQNILPTGMHLGLGVRTVATTRNFTQGTPTESGKDLDVAINGDGFFQIQMPDGTTAYTRDGTFSKDANGQLVTAGGYPLLDGITVPQDATKLSISKSGVVSVTVPGNAQPQQIGQLNTASFINPAGLEPIGENLYRESAASGAPQAGTPGTNNLGTVMQGFLESSNVNVVEELVQMIQTQRAYEMNSKAISTSDQMLAKLSQL
ncbi:flagellar basal-body rod protein FlgG [Comamonas aquatica]|uniref:flagellar basal-body rod protein FlgG n=1 Tax=Comamonas aquatica TaxID=225991 RepID=UPI00244B2980|nr:flagellar basal-body rod protein FlgG [Comamonas aquatica]MDH0200032.1 flagellar basal-body rod protein FlgG [Comamonas aquatica]MDH1444688.1 flagellar basal-body rod protein FlgG [Comamonas aquatica]MDH1764424.1 flagellar basal-body rod protein FlgG [Comamonas aquatica]